MPIGRPTKYKDKYCQDVLNYFDKEPYTYDEEGKARACPLPTLAGFARSIGVARETIWDWSNKKKEFSNAIKRAKTMQEDILITNGMFGLYEKSFCIFGAKNLMNWSDRPNDQAEEIEKIEITYKKK